MEQEKQWLNFVVEELNQKIESLEQEIFMDVDKIQEFRKYAWESRSDMDKQEILSVRSNSEQEANLLLQTREYFKKLLQIKNSPYFASIEILNEHQKKQKIYIGMTYLKKKNLDNIIYDWRSPISSIFYDFENGPVIYETPSGLIHTELLQKRQYKIENQELIRVIDSNINIEDEVLQEVLASEATDKMKNIVTTIQQEQNAVIRNVKDRNLIVQGIAGSGKTSVALHRIAFLLYKIPNLTSNKILIFSPNQIFTEYISDVLPTLGEENTLQTTFHEYLSQMITEYKLVESYPEFLKRYYTNHKKDSETFYKQSDEIIQNMEDFVKDFTNKIHFQSGFCENHVYEYSKNELDLLFHHKYNQAPFFERIRQMAEKFSEQNYRGSHKKVSTYHKLLLESLGIKKDYRAILTRFLESDFYPYAPSDLELKRLKNKKEIFYEDALLLVYLKGLLEGFFYDTDILQVVIDEAQDYSFLQYKILQKIFKKASFTILGDVNQTINPYYHYDSLEILNRIWNSKYIELNKTYRSSPEIIFYANNILHLNHVSAIQKKQNKPVIVRNDDKYLFKDIDYLLKTHKSVAIITHDDIDAKEIYEKVCNDYDVTLLLEEKNVFKNDFIIIPAYLSKGLEFESVLVYQNKEHYYNEFEKNLYYVSVTRAQHELIVYQS